MIDQSVLLNFIRNNLPAFAAAVFPEYKAVKHQLLLASKLAEVESGKVKRLCILMPPRHGKSKLSSEIFPAWALGRDPKRRILLLSYGDDLAATFGRSCRNYIKQPIFNALFPECQLSSDSNSVRKFSTTQNGFFNALSVGGSVTGKGCDIAILDDLIKNRQEADSQTYKESLVDAYKNVIRTRLQPGASIILCQTRWSTNDFVSWLLAETAHENWEVISLPAIALDHDLLGRRPGEALWSEAYPVEELRKLEVSLGTRDFNSLFQQCPIADSDIIFRQEWLRFYKDSPLEPSPLAAYFDVVAPEHEIIASWDLSFGANTSSSSWVCGQVWVYHPKTEFCYLVHQVREQLGFTDSTRAIVSVNEQYKPSRTLVEKKANGVGVIEVLRDVVPNLTAIEPKGSKEDRAYRVTPLFESGKVWLPQPQAHPWVKPLMNELETFPMGSSDDTIDAMTQALNYLQQRYRSSWLRIYDLRSDNNIFRAMGVL